MQTGWGGRWLGERSEGTERQWPVRRVEVWLTSTSATVFDALTVDISTFSTFRRLNITSSPFDLDPVDILRRRG